MLLPRLPASRLELLAKDGCSVEILQRDRHHRASPVDVHLSEELQAGERREIRRRWSLLEYHLGAESIVQRIWTEAPGVERAGDKFPERIEFLVLRLLRIIVMGRAIMHVSSEPHDILDPLAFVIGKYIGDFELADKQRLIPLATLSQRARPAESVPSGTCNPRGMSEAITFHTALDPRNCFFNQATCSSPKKAVSGPGAVCWL